MTPVRSRTRVHVTFQANTYPWRFPQSGCTSLGALRDVLKFSYIKTQISSPMEHRKDSWSTWSQTNSNLLSLTDGRKGNIWASNRYQWSQRWSMASLLHPFCYPFSQTPVLRFVKDWRWLEYMQYGFVSVYRFWSDGLRARFTTGQVFWSFDIRHLLDLVKWYSHIEGMAERLRIHVFDGWLFQKMHSELAASARTCVLGPNRPDVRNIASKRFAVCKKSLQKLVSRMCCYFDGPSVIQISFNHPFTSVTLLTLSRSVVLRWHLGSRADKLWEGADGKHSPGNVANSTRWSSKGEGQQQTRANLCKSMRICLFFFAT